MLPSSFKIAMTEARSERSSGVCPSRMLVPRALAISFDRRNFSTVSP
jgi:hypothetical protein